MLCKNHGQIHRGLSPSRDRGASHQRSGCVGYEAVEDVGPDPVLLAHFELLARCNTPGFEVLPAAGTFVALETPRTRARQTASCRRVFISADIFAS